MGWKGVLTLVALGSVALGPQVRQAPAQIPDDILVVGQTAEPKSLDPHTVTSLNDFRIIANIYDGLVRFKGGTLEVEPALATSWEVSEDGTLYSFDLREGVAFHDDAPFNAEAVKFNFERMLDASHPFHDTGPFPLAFFFEAVEEVRVVDAYRVQFLLKEPYAPLLSNLAYPTGLIASPEAIRVQGADFGRHPSGSGPYRFVEWIGNSKVVLARNPDYWGGAPRLKTLIFRPVTDPSTRITEMLSGGVDMVLDVPPDALRTFAEDERFTVYERSGPHLWFLILNTREGPFADVRMRRAVNYAIDKKALVEHVLQGTATVADGPLPRAFRWAHDDALEPYPHDPDRARALVGQAGFGGAELTFYVAEGGSGMLDPVAMATAIQADLAEIGLEVVIETFEWNTYLAKVNAGLEGRADMAEMAWMTNDPDTLPFLALHSDAWPEKGGFNSGYYANPEVDRLIEAARATPDRAERAELYKRMQAIVYHDAPWAFIASWKQNAVASRRVKGFRLEPSFLLGLHETYKE